MGIVEHTTKALREGSPKTTMHRTFLSRSQERPFASRARLDAVNQTLPLRIFLFVSIGVAALHRRDARQGGDEAVAGQTSAPISSCVNSKSSEANRDRERGARSRPLQVSISIA